MKVTHFGPGGFPWAHVSNFGGVNNIITIGSNTNTDPPLSSLNFVQAITVDGVGPLLRPIVNVASGSNITLTIDKGPGNSTPSNTVRIHATGGAASFGSNSTRVSEISSAGAGTDSARTDHIHDGIGTITASSSNTLQRGTVNLRTGNNISFGLTDSDGDGELDTVTIHGTPAAGGGGAGSSGALVFLEAHTASSSATLDFTSFISSTYDDYMFEIINLLPASNSVDLLFRTGAGSIDSGANYQYAGYYNGVSDTLTGVAAAGASSIHLANSVRNDASSLTVNASLKFYGPGSTSSFKGTSSQTQAMAVALGRTYHWTFGGSWQSTSAADRAQFLFSSGNIASGTIRVYGITKS